MTVPAPQQRFIRRGVTRIHYLKVVAAPATGPTRAEIAAGLDITGWIAGVTGFSVTSATLSVPDMGSRFAGSIPSERTVADSSFRLYDDIASEEVEETFPMDDEGFVYIMRKGDKPATPTSDLYPTRVASRTPNMTVDLAAADITASISITGEPWQDLVIPPAAA